MGPDRNNAQVLRTEKLGRARCNRPGTRTRAFNFQSRFIRYGGKPCAPLALRRLARPTKDCQMIEHLESRELLSTSTLNIVTAVAPNANSGVLTVFGARDVMLTAKPDGSIDVLA